ncbi:MAG: bile acid:sodium symporter family protein [Succinivibrio sp.]
MNPIVIVLPILTILTYNLGLTLKADDFKMLARKPLPMFVGLTGQLVFMPALAFAIASIFNLPQVFFLGFMLIACCPGGPSSNIFSYLARGDVALSVSMTAVSSIVTLFTLPFIMGVTLEYTAQVQQDTVLASVQLPVKNLLLQNLFLMVLPILLGVFTRRMFPNAALKLDKVLSKVAFPALVILATIFFIQHHHEISSYLDKLGFAVFILVMCAVAVASVLSRIFKTSSKTRRTIVIEVAMQNAAQAIAIAASPFVFNSGSMTIPAIIYALFMNVVLLAYVGLFLKDKTEVASVVLK